MTGLLIGGTSSDAGKSLVVTGLCRAYARRGLSVAPFKSQNMSNNSMVCADGSEIGRAQWLQARAAGVEPSSLHNPVLLKPGSDRRAHVVLRGRPAGELLAGEYTTERRQLAQAAFAAHAELADAVDLVVCEGAGSPAEINLRAGDYTNLGLARRFDLPIVLVGDIDRGGVLASLYGTWALLDQEDRRHLKAYVINKFRGDQQVLDPGLTMISDRTGLRCLGVLPWLEQVWTDSEDTLAVGRWQPESEGVLKVAVIRLPRISNATDVDALAGEPGVDVMITADPRVVAAADLVVVPGTRATVSDLGWLRARGLADALVTRVARGGAVLGICGGHQMLGTLIDDPTESGAGRVPGLGLLPIQVRFGAEKVLGTPSGSWRSITMSGYQIHHGRAEVLGTAEEFPGGVARGNVWGTMWHGTLESDAFRRAWLSEVAREAGVAWQPAPDAPDWADRRESMINTLADAVEEHLDLDALLALHV